MFTQNHCLLRRNKSVNLARPLGRALALRCLCINVRCSSILFYFVTKIGINFVGKNGIYFSSLPVNRNRRNEVNL